MHAVVIGGGIVGLSCAYELTLAGYRVSVLESGRVGQGASHGNAAKIVYGERGPVPGPGLVVQGIKWMLQPDSPFAVHPSASPAYVRFLLSMAQHCNVADFRRGLELQMRLGEDAGEALDSYVDAGIAFEMHSRSTVIAFESRERYDAAQDSLDIYAEFGVEPQRLVGDAVFEVEPELSDRIRYGLNVLEDRQIEPDSLTAALAAKISALGGTVGEGVEALDFRKQAGSVTHVVGTDREYEADVVVLANGVGLRTLAAKLDVHIPVYQGKGYSIDYKPAPINLSTALTLDGPHVAIAGLDGYLRIAGAMELGKSDARVSRARLAAMRRAASEGFRNWGDSQPGEQEPWAGFRPMTPDGIPVVGAVGDWQNVYAAGGHGMLGLTLAPSTARVVKDIVTGRPTRLPAHDLQALGPNRFSRATRLMRR